MLLDGFRSNPPLSKVTPFPINVILGKLFFLFLHHCILIRLGLFSEESQKKYQTLINATRYHVWSGDCHNYCLVMKGGLDLVVEQGLAAYDIFPLIPILKSQDIIITDWNSRQLSLNKNFSSKYSTVVAKDTNVYKSTIDILK